MNGAGSLDVLTAAGRTLGRACHYSRPTEVWLAYTVHSLRGSGRPSSAVSFWLHCQDVRFGNPEWRLVDLVGTHHQSVLTAVGRTGDRAAPTQLGVGVVKDEGEHTGLLGSGLSSLLSTPSCPGMHGALRFQRTRRPRFDRVCEGRAGALRWMDREGRVVVSVVSFSRLSSRSHCSASSGAVPHTSFSLGQHCSVRSGLTLATGRARSARRLPVFPLSSPEVSALFQEA